VLTRDGGPLAGVQVTANRELVVSPRPTHPHPLKLSFGLQPGVRSGADGSFSLPPFARAGTFLRVEGPGWFEEHEHPFRGDEDFTAVEVRVPMMAAVRVDAAPEGATHFELRDSDGLPMRLVDPRNVGVDLLYRAPVESEPREYEVSEAAQALVLMRGDEVLGDVPVTLVAGQDHALP
jgi:hypothetical protein